MYEVLLRLLSLFSTGGRTEEQVHCLHPRVRLSVVSVVSVSQKNLPPVRDTGEHKRWKRWSSHKLTLTAAIFLATERKY